MKEHAYRIATTMNREDLEQLLAMLVQMVIERGSVTAADYELLEQLGVEDMSVQLSFDGRHDREVDPLARLLMQVRREEYNGELWLSAVELASAAKGGSASPRQYWYSVKQRIETEDGETLQSSNLSLQLKLEASDGKMYATDMLNERGCYRVLMAIPGKQAARVRKWMAQQLQEYRRAKAAQPAETGSSLAHQALAMAQALVDHEERLQRIEQLLEAKQEEVEASLLPSAAVEAPSKPTRAALNQLVRSAARRRGAPHSFLWNALYREFTYRTSHDVARVAKNRDVQVLDIVEELGLMEVLYAIAIELYGED